MEINATTRYTDMHPQDKTPTSPAVNRLKTEEKKKKRKRAASVNSAVITDDLKSEEVLLIEDNITNRAIMGALLKRVADKVYTEAHAGNFLTKTDDELKEKYKNCRIAIIDFQLEAGSSRPNGLSLIERIQEVFPNMTTIAWSAGNEGKEQKDFDQYLTLAHAKLPKPATLEQLAKTIHEANNEKTRRNPPATQTPSPQKAETKATSIAESIKRFEQKLQEHQNKETTTTKPIAQEVAASAPSLLAKTPARRTQTTVSTGSSSSTTSIAEIDIAVTAEETRTRKRAASISNDHPTPDYLVTETTLKQLKASVKQK